jgi:SSS family solute:Na+ symporter
LVSAVFLIPKVSELGHKYKFFTFRKSWSFLQRKSGAFSWYYFCNRYIGFTSSQVLAGAKLASATIDGLYSDGIDCYGRYRSGLYFHWRVKSGNNTDTIQWLILIGGLVFIGIPVAYNAVGGYDY